MPADTSIYGLLRWIDPVKSNPHAIDEAVALGNMIKQQKQADKDNAYKEQERERLDKQRQYDAFSSSLSALSKTPEDQKPAVYQQLLQTHIDRGDIKPGMMPSEYDPKVINPLVDAFQSSPQGLERQQSVAKNRLLNAQADAALPDAQMKRELERAQINHYNAEAEKARREANNPKKNLTPGEQHADEAFAKDAAEYYYGGGKATAEKNIARMQGAIDRLKNNPDLTGGLTTKLPFTSSDAAQDTINPELASVRDEIRAAVQGSLRATLGPQFTEREGEAIFNRAFNPRLSAAENVKRATQELEAIKKMAEQKDKSMQVFTANGTLKGYSPSGTAMTNPMQTVDLSGARGGGMMNEAHASDGADKNYRKVGSKVSMDQIAQYATKHGMKASEAKETLKGMGYVVD